MSAGFCMSSFFVLVVFSDLFPNRQFYGVWFDVGEDLLVAQQKREVGSRIGDF